MNSLAPPAHGLPTELLTSIIESSNDAIICLTLKGIITIWSKAAEKTYGYAEDEVLGHSISMLIPQDHSDELASILATLKRGEGPEQYETVHLNKNGDRIDVLLTVSPVKNTAGTAVARWIITRDISERKRADAAFKRREAEFRAVFEHAGIGIALVDAKGQLIRSNRTLQQMLGYSEDELRGFDFRKFTHPLDLEKAVSLFVELMEGKRDRHQLEKRYIRKDGSIIWVRLTASAVRTREGEAKYCVGMVEDITAREQAENQLLNAFYEQKKTEAALQKREAEYRAIFEHAGVGIALMGANGQPIHTNPAAQQMLGYTDDELRHLSIKDLTHPSDLEESMSLFNQEVEGKLDHYQLEKRYIRKDGSVIWGRLTSSVVWSRSGEPAYYISMVEDITARKEAEIELRNSEQRLSLLVEQSPLGFIGWDLDFNITEWNPAAGRIFGYAREEVLGRDLRFLVPDSAREHVSKIVQEVMTRKVFRRGTNENLTKDGRTILCEWYNSPLVDSHCHVIGSVALCEDVTAQRKLEDQFRQAQKMEAVGRLAGGVAHDFNNHLNVIMGYASLLQREVSRERVRESADEIVRAAERATTLTRQLLAFSRKKAVQQHTLDLNDAVAGISSMLRQLIGEDIEVNIRAADDSLCVRAGTGQIEQVIMNLAVNARDAMPDGGQLTITTSKAELSHDAAKHLGLSVGTHCVLTVSDTGHGMDAETQKHLFEPFFTTKAPGKGTGLGLATVHGIVTQSGGTISVDSTVNVGTTFTIYLPFAEGEAENVVSSPPVALDPALRASETILLVEDEANLRILVKRLMQSEGYTILDADNGKSALEIACSRSGPIDILVTDMIMPRMHGRDLAKRIRELRPGIEVLYITGYADVDLPTDEHTSVLEKPFTPDALLHRLRQVLAGRKRKQVAGTHAA